MLESKLIWMYFQSNSIPLAPTHRGRHLKSHNRTQTARFSVYMCTIIKLLFLLQEQCYCLPWHHKFCCCPAHGGHHDLVLSFTSITRHHKVEAQQVCQVHCCLHKFLENKHTYHSLVCKLVLWIVVKIRQSVRKCESSFLKLLLWWSFNTHPYKVINSCSSFPCREKCS